MRLCRAAALQSAPVIKGLELRGFVIRGAPAGGKRSADPGGARTLSHPNIFAERREGKKVKKDKKEKKEKREKREKKDKKDKKDKK